MRTPRALVAVLVVSLAGLLLLRHDERTREPSAARATEPEQAVEPARLLSPSPGPERAPAPREASVEEPRLERAAERETPEAAPRGGIALRGQVRWADGREAVPNLRLLAEGVAGIRCILISDQHGRFESEPLFTPGRLRLRNMGEAPRTSDQARHPSGLRLEEQVFLIPEETGIFDVELRLLRPALWLDVEVVERTGGPVEGARVELESVAAPGLGWGEHNTWTSATDASGRTTFALYDVAGIRSLGLWAELRPEGGTGPVLASDHRVLEPPLTPGRDVAVRLVVDEAARLRVRTADELGQPVAGCWVWLEVQNGPLFAWLPGGTRTGAGGELLLDGLPPGTYVVAARSDDEEVRSTVELARGIEVVQELVLLGGAPRLSVAGIVLDERGEPLPRARVTVEYDRPPGSAEALVSRLTGADGRFEFEAAPVAGLTVSLDGDLWGDEFTPPGIEATFGERNLVFRRTRRVERRQLDLEIVDAADGHRLESSLVITVRPPGTPTYEFVSVVGGLCTLVVGEHPDVRLLFDAPGYRRQAVVPLELLRSQTARRLHRIALERGLSCRLEVRAAAGPGETGTVLPGAAVLDGSRCLGVTGADGGLALDLREWPAAPLRVEAPGHRAVAWSPADTLGEPGPAVVVLDPAD